MQVSKGGYQEAGGAWIHPQARIAEGVSIEPGAVVGPEVEVGRGCWLGAGAVLYGPTVLGEENQVHPTAVLGGAPQDPGYRGEPTRLVIGHRNVFREAVTVSRGSTQGEGVTRIGNDNYFMAGSHVGHDCVVEDEVVLANDVLIDGHCRVQSHANLGGAVAIVQFSTVGRYAFIGGLSGTTMDCEPFLAYDDMPARPKGVNLVGLRRGHFSYHSINSLKEAYRLLYSQSLKGGEDLDAVRRALEKRGALSDEAIELLEFVKRSREGRCGRQAQGHGTVKLIPEAPPRQGT